MASIHNTAKTLICNCNGFQTSSSKQTAIIECHSLSTLSVALTSTLVGLESGQKSERMAAWQLEGWHPRLTAVQNQSATSVCLWHCERKHPSLALSATSGHAHTSRVVYVKLPSLCPSLPVVSPLSPQGSRSALVFIPDDGLRGERVISIDSEIFPWEKKRF